MKRMGKKGKKGKQPNPPKKKPLKKNPRANSVP